MYFLLIAPCACCETRRKSFTPRPKMKDTTKITLKLARYMCDCFQSQLLNVSIIRTICVAYNLKISRFHYSKIKINKKQFYRRMFSWNSLFIGISLSEQVFEKKGRLSRMEIN